MMKQDSESILLCRDLEEMSRKAAELFVGLLQEAIASRGRFRAALSGGNTPVPFYSLLAEDPFRERVPWSKVHLFWGDERCVPLDHADSNYRRVREVLLDKIPIPNANVYPIPVGRLDAQTAATLYEKTLRKAFALGKRQTPRFDLMLMGMGEDGHTASLFPGSTALEETEQLVVANHVEQLGVDRVTLTAPVINGAANVVFLISGRAKAKVLREVLEGDYDPNRLPTQLIRPRDGKLLFITDNPVTEAAVNPEK